MVTAPLMAVPATTPSAPDLATTMRFTATMETTLSQVARVTTILGGDDLIFGGTGNDGTESIDGGLRGGAGSDTLSGGAGADVLYGETGADTFRFDSVIHSRPGAGRDSIVGDPGTAAFARAGRSGGDVIDVSRIDADTTRGGEQDFTFGGTGRGRLWTEEGPGDSTLVRGNVDLDGTIEFEILIDDGVVRASAYTAGDFIL